ncbi:hypothetical protein BDM02DRAFT_3112224 [Thelephora ganbajun]|uniref:Uncharacterized protein n=1 Tax=Thelephora ganbajun TaxID=370292 RepID=A0ACB6ZLI3_THEGA|nr:hypothetical protein BDM02DRAFT_3112224 [Thelephora ganbajun]
MSITSGQSPEIASFVTPYVVTPTDPESVPQPGQPSFYPLMYSLALLLTDSRTYLMHIRNPGSHLVWNV